MKRLKRNWVIGVSFLSCFIFVFHIGFADDTCILTTDGRFYTFTAPVVPATRTTSSNRIYLAFFRPGVENFWAGNVVKLGISADGEIVDANGVPATWTNGAIKESAVPYWATIDWADPTKSDYNYILNSDRNIYTYLGSSRDLTASANAFISSNPGLTPAVLGNPTHSPEEIIGYIRGADEFDEDDDGDTRENRDVITGDVLHSEPCVVQYNYQDNSSKTMVFFGSNDGMLHAVLDAETTTNGTEINYGTEAWAVIPPDQLHRLKDIRESEGHQYFVDSSPKAYIRDWNKNGAADTENATEDWNGDGVIDDDDKELVILVCGERKGGTSYFALDVTDPSAPLFLWRINQYSDAETGTLELEDVTGTFEDGEVLTGSSGGSATVAGVPIGNLLRYELRTSNFTVGEVVTGVTSEATGTIVSVTNYAPDVIISELGETWAEPQFGLVKTSDEDDAGTAVFFIGGGYSADNSKGKAILAVNVFTGAVVKKFSGINGMNYSFASAVTVVDGDSNGFVDKVYVGDLGSQMWRIGKFTDPDGNPLAFPATDENIMNWTDQAAQIIFRAGCGEVNCNNGVDDNLNGVVDEWRKFFYPPSVTLEWGYDLVFMGTGDREDPCNLISSDRIYAVKDSHDPDFETLTEMDLVDVTDTPGTPADLNIHQGWYIQLEEGEKVLSEGVVFFKTYYVTTFLPGEGGTLYALNYKTAEAISGFSARRIWEAGGLLSKPVVIITKSGQKLMVSAGEINTGGSGTGSVGPGILVIEPAAPPSNFFYLWWKEL